MPWRPLDSILDHSPRVRLETETFADLSEAEDCSLPVRGTIFLCPDPDEDDQLEIVVGSIEAFYVRLGLASEAGIDYFDVLDARSETAEFAELLDPEEDDAWDPVVEKHLDFIVDLDVLVLHDIHIEPEYRGRGLGLVAARAVIDVFASSCGLILFRPFPIQFSGYKDEDWPNPEGLTDPDAAFAAAERKLRRYWARLGAKQVPNTDIFGINTSLVMPSRATLLHPPDAHRSHPSVMPRRRCQDGWTRSVFK